MIQDACKCPLEIVFYYLNGPTPGSLNSHYQVNDVTQTLESKGADICYTMYPFSFKIKKMFSLKLRKRVIFLQFYLQYIGLEITVNDGKLLKLTFMVYSLYYHDIISRERNILIS